MLRPEAGGSLGGIAFTNRPTARPGLEAGSCARCRVAWVRAT